MAPYEADSQLSFLNRTGIADFIISEDSDLAPFGCDKILFKMDMMGQGILVSVVFQWFHARNQEKTSENEQKKQFDFKCEITEKGLKLTKKVENGWKR